METPAKTASPKAKSCSLPLVWSVAVKTVVQVDLSNESPAIGLTEQRPISYTLALYVCGVNLQAVAVVENKFVPVLQGPLSSAVTAKEVLLISMRENNNSILGKEILKKKKEKILEVFDKAEDKEETRTSIADKVAKSLGVNCNRKLVRAVLDAKRSSKLEKLKKIS